MAKLLPVEDARELLRELRHEIHWLGEIAEIRKKMGESAVNDVCRTPAFEVSRQEYYNRISLEACNEKKRKEAELQVVTDQFSARYLDL